MMECTKASRSIADSRGPIAGSTPLRRLRTAGAALLLAACVPAAAERAPVGDATARELQQAYLVQLDSAKVAADRLAMAADALTDGAPERLVALRTAFADARRAYKRVELFVEYYAPAAADLLNGPALPEMEPDAPNVVIEPEGFQVIEELVFGDDPVAERVAIRTQAEIASSHLLRVRRYAEGMVFTPSAIVDAARLELARAVTLGLANFDSPVAEQGGREMAIALDAVREALAPLAARNRAATAAEAWRAYLAQHDAVQARLAAAPAAGPEDRLALLAEGLDPLMQRLGELRRALDIPVPDEPRLWRASAASLFERGAWDPFALAPAHAPALRDTAAAVALGAQLFADPVLSRDGTRACTSCHLPERAYTDGRARSIARDGSRLRNAPTVLNAGLQVGSFWDLRTTYLEDQVSDVVGNAAEMHGDLDQAAGRLSQDPAYAAAFRAAFGAPRSDVMPATPERIRSAVAAFLRDKQAMDSRFDRYMRGERAALNDEERHGFNVFVGKAKCATCHFVPLFNGTVPPGYVKAEQEVLGVPTSVAERGARLDADEGVYAVTRLKIQRYAFKTPTVRNAAVTAPYFHNGAYGTLDEVIRFYELGGGAGIGITLENQTLPGDRLDLTPADKQALIAFMRALTDTAAVSAYGPKAVAAR